MRQFNFKVIGDVPHDIAKLRNFVRSESLFPAQFDQLKQWQPDLFCLLTSRFR